MTHKPEPPVTWPDSSILLWGTIGTDSLAGKRYQRCIWALALMILGIGLGALLPIPYHHAVALFPGLAFAFIAIEMWRYVDSLEELERRLRMEALAWTYVISIALAMSLGGLAMAIGWKIDPAWLIAMEPLRTWRLHASVRRFK